MIILRQYNLSNIEFMALRFILLVHFSSFMIQSFKKNLINHINEIIKTKPTPHAIALGFATGSFISILPTPGLNFAIGFLILIIFKRLNKYSLFLALIFWNTLTLAPIYLLSYKIGDILFSTAQLVTLELSLLDRVYIFTRRFLVGNIILAIAIPTILYFLIKKIAKNYFGRNPSLSES